MSNQDTALSLARAGLAVFPCGQDKKPLIGAWRENSTTDETTIQNWWLGQRGALPAIDCGKSGLVVIDCDRHKDQPDGVKAFKALCKKHGQSFDNLLIVKTPSGGRHIYFRQPTNGRPFTNSRGDLPPGIDVRGDGGYVIAIGAELADGRKYESTKSLADINGELPTWSAEILRPVEKPSPTPKFEDKPANEREQAYAAAALDNIAGELATAAPGARNEQLNKAAFRLGTMVARGWIDHSKIEIRLADAAAACGLVKDDGRRAVVKTINSGITAGMKSPHDDLLPQATKKGEQPSALRFKLVSFNELRPGTEPPYLVDGLIPRTGIAVNWGPPKCGKSFWTFDLCMHVALNWAYRGRRVEAGTVVYAAFEGAVGFRKRAEAFRLHHQLEIDPAFYLITARADLAKDHIQLVADIRAQLGEVKPTVVVLDTLNRSLAGSESKDDDMGAYLRGADAIREAFDCVVIIVHHCGINDTRPRGHTSLTGAVDAQLAVSRDGAGNIVVLVEWLKDGAEGEQVVSKLETVNVGTDQAGGALTSCVVVPSEIAKTATGGRLTANQQTMFAILHDAGERGLSTGDWYDRAREAGIGSRRKADLYDIRSTLVDKRLIRQTTNGWTVNHQ